MGRYAVQFGVVVAALAAGCSDRVDLVPVDASMDASDAPPGDVCVQSATPSLLSGAAFPWTASACLQPRTATHTTPDGERVDCVVRERAVSGASLPCEASRGRSADGDGGCVVAQLASVGSAAPTAGHGFYLRRGAGTCALSLGFTEGDAPTGEVSALVECVLRNEGVTPAAVVPACHQPVGARCAVTPPGGTPCAQNPAGCLRGTEILLEAGGVACGSGLCLAYRYDEASDTTGAQRDRMACTCRCAVPESMRASVDPRTLCTCPTGFACTPLANDTFGSGLAGSYCVRSSFVN